VRPLFASILLSSLSIAAPCFAQEPQQPAAPEASAGVGRAQQERNKELARGFYEDLWFSQNTDRYAEYVADEYVIHDIGDTKDVIEPGIMQKGVADFPHANGNMSGSLDFQIADGDLVATRLQWDFEPTSLLFRMMGGRRPLPVINVFRFQDGKIVEIWNHRHDIDWAWGNILFYKGLGVGLLIALPGWGIAFVSWRRSRKAPGRRPQ
jgi:predicted SnoaL-like aldol condensation-catalyzing enzyme